MDAPKNITANYVEQFKLTLAITAGVPGGLANITGGTNGTYYDTGTALSLAATTPVADGPGKQWAFKNWTGDVTTPPNTSNPVSVTMNAPKSVAANYTVQWQITFAANGLSPDAVTTANVVTVNGTITETVAQMPYIDWYDAGSTVNWSYLSPVASTVAGKRYVQASAPPKGPYTVTAAITFTATYKPQYDTQTAVTSSVNPSVLAQSVYFTATVSTIATGGGTPTGSVQFNVDGSPFGTAVTLAGGTANSATTTTLTIGPHTVNAVYTPATDDFTGSGASLNQKVIFATGGMCDGEPGHAILQPINVDGSSVFKQSRTVPTKFRVCDANGNSVGPTTAFPNVVTNYKVIGAVGGAGSPNEDVVSTTPDTMFRWSPTDQLWIFNTATKGLTAGFVYTFEIDLVDGSNIVFRYGLR